ncbi:MAG: adenylyl-sulfate kinase [Acidimicrobiia bacterium]|nr:adenylyl-sulfate kinase [Acidimicrobiia bacterium]
MILDNEANPHVGYCIWLSGRPGSGKHTLARLVYGELTRRNIVCELLERDSVARSLDLGPRLVGDGTTDTRRLGWISTLLAKHGVTSIVVADTTWTDAAEETRVNINNFVEVFIDTPQDLCIERKGSDAAVDYSKPIAPELRVLTHDRDEVASAAQIISFLELRGLFT